MHIAIKAKIHGSATPIAGHLLVLKVICLLPLLSLSSLVCLSILHLAQFVHQTLSRGTNARTHQEGSNEHTNSDYEGM